MVTIGVGGHSVSVIALQVPPWWPWLLLLPVVAVWAWRSSRRAAARRRAVLGRREHGLLGSPRWTRVRPLLAGTSVLLCALALLRPVAPGSEAALAPDVVLCVDVSRSMDARDLPPSRFLALRAQVHELLQAAVGARVALVAFAGDAVPVAPLTADREAVAWLLDELVPGAHAPGGSDLGAAIAAAANALERVGTHGELVLLTDGEDFAGRGAAAARAAAAAGHRVHALGFGRAAGSKIVVERAGVESFLRDGQGRDVVTRLDREGLRALAAAGGGAFLSVESGGELLALWREHLLPRAQRQRLAAGAAGAVLLAHWPLLAGLLLWIVRMCLPERRR